MALIEVNHKTLEDVASAVEAYCAVQDREMSAADADVKSMLTDGWLGADAMEFGKIWEAVDDSDSTTVKFRESLKKFGDGLSASAAEYKRAQEDAYNAASLLPKYLYW